MLPLSYGLEVIHFLEHHKQHGHFHNYYHHHHHHHHLHHHQLSGGNERLRFTGQVSIDDVPESVPPVELVFRNVTMSCKEKIILQNISGMVMPGELLAVMGPSGSGKTTLLNALAGRVKMGSGSVTLNGEELNKDLRRRICYVKQEDVFLGNLTLRQTLMFQVRLQQPSSMCYQAKKNYMESLAADLDLTHCLKTKMDSLSGGEKKRANIACELLTNPALVLIDEPTSGLDSSTAYTIMSLLKTYAVTKGKTVVVTVHQPSSQIFHMFDRILLLCKGQVAYFGEERIILDHFNRIGFQIQNQPYYNPGDFIMELLKGDAETQDKIIREAEILRDRDSDSSLEKKLHANGNIQPVDVKVVIDDRQAKPAICLSKDIREEDSGWFSDSSHHGDFDKWPTSFWTQLLVLTERNFCNSHERMLSKLQWIQTFGLALVCGLMWFQIPRKEETIFSLRGMIFFFISYWMLHPMFTALTSFPAEQAVINKERASGAYRSSAYFIAKMISELPLLIALPTFFFVIAYPMIGCYSLYTFLSTLGFMLLSAVAAQSIGLFIGCLCPDVETSLTTASLLSLSSILFGGFYSATMPFWMSWLRYLSMVHYAFESMQTIEFLDGWPVECATENSLYTACRVGNATFVPPNEIMNHGGEPLSLWANAIILFTFFLVFRYMGYLALRYVRKPK